MMGNRKVKKWESKRIEKNTFKNSVRRKLAVFKQTMPIRTAQGGRILTFSKHFDFNSQFIPLSLFTQSDVLIDEEEGPSDVVCGPISLTVFRHLPTEALAPTPAQRLGLSEAVPRWSPGLQGRTLPSDFHMLYYLLR